VQPLLLLIGSRASCPPFGPSLFFPFNRTPPSLFASYDLPYRERVTAPLWWSERRSYVFCATHGFSKHNEFPGAPPGVPAMVFFCLVGPDRYAVALHRQVLAGECVAHAVLELADVRYFDNLFADFFSLASDFFPQSIAGFLFPSLSHSPKNPIGAAGWKSAGRGLWVSKKTFWFPSTFPLFHAVPSFCPRRGCTHFHEGPLSDQGAF